MSHARRRLPVPTILGLALLVHAAVAGVAALFWPWVLPGGEGDLVTVAQEPALPGLEREIRPEPGDVRPIEQEERVVETPVIRDAKAADHIENNIDPVLEESLGGTDFITDGPFEGPSTNAAIGIGGGAGGASGGRGGRRALKAMGGAAGRAEIIVVERRAAPVVWEGVPVGEGSLLARNAAGKSLGAFPLEHTDVAAEVTGFLASVVVTQVYRNEFTERVEAVYVFPLPLTAAVSGFTLTAGDRTIHGVVREREEARRVYEQAKARGYVASLVTEERPNIFTQSLANLEPGAAAKVEITYFDVLPQRAGAFEFAFPMVVAPRYVGGRPLPGPVGGGGFAPDTEEVPDGSRISPMPVLPGTRPGHDLSLALSLRAGVPIESIECPTHEIVVERPAPNRAEVALAARAVVPNRDFVLRYRLAGERLGIAPLVHRGALGGFFALFLVPPADLPGAAAIPREVVFLVDASGSMEGEPLAKAKAVVRECLARLRDFDTFRLVCFSDEAREFSPETRPLGAGDVEAALAFLDWEDGHGGTEMMSGIRAALGPPVPEGCLRVVCLLTDGCIGGEVGAFAAVRARSPGTRVFCVGVGSSVNRYLVEGVAREGGGEALWALPATPAEETAAEFARVVDSPCLAEVEVDFGGLPVRDLCPAEIPDLRPGCPVLLVGRCEGGGAATVTVRGFDGAGTHSFAVPVEFPEWEEENAALAQFWARRKVADLLEGSQGGFESVRRQALTLALDFGIVSPLTALVAVDESRETGGGVLLRVDVPVALPEGVSFAGNFGRPEDLTGFAALGLTVAAEDEGLRVFAVAPGSPAESAGIAAGNLVAGCVPAAGLVRLVVERDGVRREVTFRLAR